LSYYYYCYRYYYYYRAMHNGLQRSFNNL